MNNTDFLYDFQFLIKGYRKGIESDVEETCFQFLIKGYDRSVLLLYHNRRFFQFLIKGYSLTKTLRGFASSSFNSSLKDTGSYAMT